MSCLIWWHERLVAQNPLKWPAIPNYDYRPSNVEPLNWHEAVARRALYRDYMKWHNEVFLLPYKNNSYYQDNLRQIPPASNELEFFSTMGPMFYVTNKGRQTRGYKVEQPCLHEGRWITIKKNRYFIRLVEWSLHCAAYEISTGRSLYSDITYFQEEKARMLSEASKIEEEKSRKREELTIEAMRKD